MTDRNLQYAKKSEYVDDKIENYIKYFNEFNEATQKIEAIKATVRFNEKQMEKRQILIK